MALDFYFIGGGYDVSGHISEGRFISFFALVRFLTALLVPLWPRRSNFLSGLEMEGGGEKFAFQQILLIFLAIHSPLF